MTDETPTSAPPPVAPPVSAEPPPIPPAVADQITALVRGEISNFALSLTNPHPADGGLLHEFKAKIRLALTEMGFIIAKPPSTPAP